MKTSRLALFFGLGGLLGLGAILLSTAFFASTSAQQEFPRFENSVVTAQPSEFAWTEKAMPAVITVGGSSFASISAQQEFPSFENSVVTAQPSEFAWTEGAMPAVITVGGSSWVTKPSGVFSVYDGSSVTTFPVSTFTNQYGSSKFELTVVNTGEPIALSVCSTGGLTRARGQSRTFAYDGLGSVVASPPSLTFNTLANLPEISFKTFVRESTGDSIVAVAIPVSVGVAIVETAVYRLEHFVGRLGIGSLSLLGFVSLLAVVLPRTLHLPGSYGPAVPMTCTSACGGTPGTVIDFTVRRSGVWNNLQETPSTGGLIVLSDSCFS